MNNPQTMVNIMYSLCRDIDNLIHISQISAIETGYLVIDRYTKNISQGYLMLGLKESIPHFQLALIKIRFQLAAFFLGLIKFDQDKLNFIIPK